MIPYALPDKFRIVKIENKKSSDGEQILNNSTGELVYVATVKIFFNDADGDPFSKVIKITFPSKKLQNFPLSKLGFKNLMVGSYKDNFYFKADGLIAKTGV